MSRPSASEPLLLRLPETLSALALSFLGAKDASSLSQVSSSFRCTIAFARQRRGNGAACDAEPCSSPFSPPGPPRPEAGGRSRPAPLA